MKFSVKSVVAGAAALALSGGLLVVGASSAQAATFDPDPNAVGTVTLFDAAGNQIAGGLLSDSPLAAYYKASGPKVGAFAANFGYVTYYTPQDGVPTGSWTTGEQWTSAQNYTTAQAAYPAGLTNPATNVVIKGATTDGPFTTHITNFPSASVANPNVYQLRLYTSASATTYYSANIQVNTAAGTWSQVYPVLPTQVNTTTTVSALPASPITVGTATTFSASVTPASGTITNGSVQFLDGATPIGTAPYTGTNPVSIAATTLTQATHSITAKYVPAGLGFNGSTSAALSYVVNPVQIATTTSVGVNTGTGNGYAPVTITATTAPAAAGSVVFTDSVAGNLGPAVTSTAGVATLVTSALGAGPHTVTGVFTPTDPITYGPSTGVSTAFTLALAGATPDPQTIQVVVAPGTLTITTPYTPTNPYKLGTMALDPTATFLSASQAFGDAANPANGVTITDTRAGDLPWTASAAAVDFTSGVNTIDAHGLGFTSVVPQYIAGNALNNATKPVTVTQVPSYAPSNALYSTSGLKGAPHQFAAALHGVGTVYITGTLGLYAPTSTVAGTYSTVLTFTAA